MYDWPISFPCEVAGLIDSSHGKFPESENDPFGDPTNKASTAGLMTIIMEYDEFLPYIIQYLPSSYGSSFRDFIASCGSSGSGCSLYSYADYVALNMPEPREEFYASSDYDSI